jgi:hypothetical protein
VDGGAIGGQEGEFRFDGKKTIVGHFFVVFCAFCAFSWLSSIIRKDSAFSAISAVNIFIKNVRLLLNIPAMFGIITIATEVAEDGGQVAREKPIFWLVSQCFKHLNLYNLNLFRISIFRISYLCFRG